MQQMELCLSADGQLRRWLFAEDVGYFFPGRRLCCHDHPHDLPGEFRDLELHFDSDRNPLTAHTVRTAYYLLASERIWANLRARIREAFCDMATSYEIWVYSGTISRNSRDPTDVLHLDNLDRLEQLRFLDAWPDKDQRRFSLPLPNPIGAGLHLGPYTLGVYHYPTYFRRDEPPDPLPPHAREVPSDSTNPMELVHQLYQCSYQHCYVRHNRVHWTLQTFLDLQFRRTRGSEPFGLYWAQRNNFHLTDAQLAIVRRHFGTDALTFLAGHCPQWYARVPPRLLAGRFDVRVRSPPLKLRNAQEFTLHLHYFTDNPGPELPAFQALVRD